MFSSCWLGDNIIMQVHWCLVIIAAGLDAGVGSHLLYLHWLSRADLSNSPDKPLPPTKIAVIPVLWSNQHCWWGIFCRNTRPQFRRDPTQISDLTLQRLDKSYYNNTSAVLTDPASYISVFKEGYRQETWHRRFFHGCTISGTQVVRTDSKALALPPPIGTPSCCRLPVHSAAEVPIIPNPRPGSNPVEICAPLSLCRDSSWHVQLIFCHFFIIKLSIYICCL